MSLKISFDAAAAGRFVNALRADVQQAVRPAAQAGSQVLYEQVKANAPSSRSGHWFHGTSFKSNGKKYWFDAGTLKRAIYQTFSADNSTPDQSTYHISWNHKKVPYGHMVEYGTVHSRPVAFVRRAASAQPRALAAAHSELNRQLKEFK